MKKIFFSLFLLLSITATAFAGPTIAAATDTTQLPAKDSIFTKVDIESDFPGGQAGWIRYLQANLTYPKKAIRQNVQGTVIIQFIVNKDGTVTNVQAISGPELLRQAAVDVLRNTPRWTPASQNGRKVKSYKKQPIIFRLE